MLEPLTTYTVATDAPDRERAMKTYIVPWRIEGKLEIRAEDAGDAYHKAIRFSEMDLAISGELEMDKPEEALP